MNKYDFIYTMLQKYGKYTKTDIKNLVTDDNKTTIHNLSKEQLKYGLVENLYSEESNKKRADKIYSRVKSYIKEVNTFLDFGGATGDIAHYLGGNFKASKIYCIDKEEWLDITFKRRKDVIFYNDTSKIEDNSIDLLLVSHTLHHIDDATIVHIIKEFNRILSNDGIIILQ